MTQEKEMKEGNEHHHIHHLTINGKKHIWQDQYITGAELRKLGSIPKEDDIFLSIPRPDKDEEIQDHTKVDLGRPGVEHFYSKEKHHEIVIIVNGSPKKWEKKEISFKEVIILAYGEYIDNPLIVYTVAYEDGPRENPEGSMIKGAVVCVKNKMIFHATFTDKS